MLFENLRRKIWLNKIMALSDFDLSMKEAIESFETRHLTSLSKILNKIKNKDDEYDRNIYILWLKIFINGNGTKNLNESQKLELKYFKKMLQDYTSSITNEIKCKVLRKLPDHLSLNTDNVNQSIFDLLLMRADEKNLDIEDIKKQMINDIGSNPKKYIKGLDICLNKLAEKLFNVLHEETKKDLPADCSLNKSSCLSEIIRIFNNNIPESINNLESLYTDTKSKMYNCINDNPFRFITGLEQIISKNASTLFNDLKLHLSPNLPNGITFDDTVCIGLIIDLIKAGTDPSELAQKFMDIVTKYPLTYFLKNGRPISHQFKSSNESSSGADQAMLTSSRRW